MEAYYYSLTGKSFPSIMELQLHEYPLRESNVIFITFEETSLSSMNRIHNVLIYPHPDSSDFFYILIESENISQSIQRYIGNLSFMEIKSLLIEEKVIPHGVVIIACSSSKV